MFEGKLPSARNSGASATGDSPEAELCAISWADLVVKLQTARELRDSLAANSGEGAHSFDADSARRLAALPDFWAQHEGQDAVNLDDLGNGKANWGNAAADASRSTPGV